MTGAAELGEGQARGTHTFFLINFLKLVKPATDNFYHVVLFFQTVKSNILLSLNAGNANSDTQSPLFSWFQASPLRGTIHVLACRA